AGCDPQQRHRVGRGSVTAGRQPASRQVGRSGRRFPTGSEPSLVDTKRVSELLSAEVLPQPPRLGVAAPPVRVLPHLRSIAARPAVDRSGVAWRGFLALLGVCTLVRLVMAAHVPMSGDEAYYCLWAQHLA